MNDTPLGNRTNPGIGPGKWHAGRFGTLAQSQESHANGTAGHTSAAVVFRLYTEDLPNVALQTSRYFRGFSLFPVVGYYDGARENGLVVEVVVPAEGASHTAQRFSRLATDIIRENHQSLVLVYQSGVRKNGLIVEVNDGSTLTSYTGPTYDAI